MGDEVLVARGEVLRLEECSPDLALEVGGKALGLGSLIEHGLPVPPGFVVTAGAYRRSIEAAGLAVRIAEILEVAGDRRGDAEASAAIQVLFTDDVLDDAVAVAIASAYEELGAGEDLLVAVRSSATAEDTAEASFAGQQDTYLGVRGLDAVKRHVVRCWASLFTPHAIAYRRRFDVPADGLAMAVVVQALVPAEAAGVMMTLEPVRGDRSLIYVEAAYGLGEGVVRGDVGSDRFWIRKRDLELDEEQIGTKAHAHRVDPGTGLVALVQVPEEAHAGRSLTSREVLAVGALGREVEERFGMPVDVEWALAPAGDGGERELFLLQARPETVWSNRAEPAPEDAVFDPGDAWDPLHTWSSPDDHWTRSNIGEAIPGVQTPLSWTLWSHGAELATREAAFAVGAISAAERVLPLDPEKRHLRAFMGRSAMRVEYLTGLGDRMPGTTGRDVALSVYGSVPEDIVYRPTRRRHPFVAWRLPRSFLSAPRRIRALAAENERWYPEAIGRVERSDLDGAQRLFAGAKERFDAAVVLQTIGLLAVIQPLFDALEKIVARASAGDVATLSGSGGAEMAVVEDAWRAAHGELGIVELVARHGFHGPFEGELSSPVWREDRTPLQRVVERYAGRPRPAPTSPEARARMQREVIGRFRAPLRPLVWGILRLAESRILLRGVAKRSFLQAFDVARAAARRAGDLLAADGRLDDPADVFYLTADELTGALPGDAQELVAMRRARRAEYERLELPGNWKGMPVAMPAGHPGGDDDESAEAVRGTGVSSGVVEGLVRVVTDPSFADVEPDEVLVAPTTDPSWSSIMFVSSALVVDIGGALSHAAVVARELGIPCVVSAGDGTRRLRTGDRVRVDGGTGVVEILERAGAPAPLNGRSHPR